MTEFLRNLLSTEGFHPHGYCYLWRADLVWLHVISDSLIGFAYVAIGMTLAYFVRKGSGDIPFSRIFVAFGVFIAACGATHFMEIWTLWSPVYWLSGSVKVVTAGASVVTALVLPPLVPLALGTIRAARVSERRKEELEIAHSRLADTHAELEQLYERLKEADETKTRFFANVSHELRTPLTLILGPVERMLEEGELGASQRAQLRTVDRNARLMLHHVNDLLALQKLGASAVELRYRRVDIAALARIWASHFDSISAEKAIELECEIPEHLEAELDQERIGRVMFNLLGNAFKFTPRGGRVRLTVGGDGDPDDVVLQVEDSGPGIAPEDRERVFEAFRQADEGMSRRYEGTGLGLAIVHELVTLHGGSVDVGDSALGGARFVVSLPRRAPEGTNLGGNGDPAAAAGPAAGSAPPSITPRDPVRERTMSEDEPPGTRTAGPSATSVGMGERPLVLVVEDNSEMREFIGSALADEFRVATASEGSEGLRLASELGPDVILSDIMMPGLSGDAMLRGIRRVPELAAVPVILLSARADDRLRVRLLGEGAQDYLTKPFATSELRVRVRNWASIKRAGDVLRAELETSRGDVEGLARELADRNRDLDGALAAARVALEAAEQASRAKSDFLSVMSHELRTPLNAILGYADLLEIDREHPLTELQQERLERIRRSSASLVRMIDEVLLYARAQAGEEAPQRARFDLAALLGEVVGSFRSASAEKGVALELRTPTAGVQVIGDQTWVRLAASALVENAVKFTERGAIQVSARIEGGRATVRVRDTGPGIAPEHRERVFEPFWQADGSMTRTAGGTGLGLALARQIAKLLDGTVDVRSVPGEGSEFTLALPIADVPSDLR
jgi:signal transduction histidine kinase